MCVCVCLCVFVCVQVAIENQLWLNGGVIFVPFIFFACLCVCMFVCVCVYVGCVCVFVCLQISSSGADFATKYTGLRNRVIASMSLVQIHLQQDTIASLIQFLLLLSPAIKR